MFRTRSPAESAVLSPGAASPSRKTTVTLLTGWLPLAAVLVVIIALWASGSATVYERPGLAAALYLVFALPASGLVAVLLARSFLAQGAAKLLLVGMGAVFWACAGTAGSMAGISKGQADFTNTLLTIHNIGMWLSALCHLAGATLTVRWRVAVRSPFRWLAAGYGLALTTMVVLVLATVAEWLPSFFIPGQGATLVRKLVLFSTAAMLGITGMLFAAQRPSRDQGFTYWYGQALLFFALGVLALVLSVPGTLLGWTGRITLAVGSIYMLIAVLKSLRQRTGQDFVPEARFSEGGLAYAVAVAAVAAAAAVRVLLLPALEGGNPFITFYAALAFAGVYGGWRAGVLATSLAAPVAAYFWIEPIGQFAVKNTSDWVGIIVFLIVGTLITWIADRMRSAEAALLAQRDRLDELVRERTAELVEAQRVARLGHWHWDFITDEMKVSDEILILFGRSSVPPGSEWAGTLYTLESWQKFEIARQEAQCNGSPFNLELEAQRGDGAGMWIEIRGEPLCSPDGKVVGLRGTMQDISQRKQAEEALRQSEARFSTLYDANLVGVLVGNGKGEVKEANDYYLEIIGHTREELEKAQIDWRRITPPEWLPADERALAELAATGLCTPYEKEYLRRDGSRRSVFLFDAMLPGDQGDILVVALDMTRQREDQREIVRLNADLENRVAERTQELTRSNEALMASNEELQRFAYIASHDLQTPLRTITSFSQLLQKDYRGRPLDERGTDYLDRVTEGARRMHFLIRDLLAYSRVDSQARPFMPVDVETVFNSMVSALGAVIDETGAQVTHGELPKVVGDPGQLTQLLQNLVENGIKYHGPGRPEVHIWAERQPGEWLFCVRDNGIGIAPKHREAIFEVFRRLHTQQTYPGTGIGLAVCRRVVERHGGRIWVESEPGKGSTFKFTLPFVKEVADHGRRATDGPAIGSTARREGQKDNKWL